MKPTAATLLLFVLVSLLWGCAGYRPGALPDTEVASVYLKPVQNEAYISGIAPLFQSALRKGILESRLLRPVDDAEDADMIAYIRLRDYEEEPIGFLETDTGQPISARVQLAAVIQLEDSAENPILTGEVIQVESAVYSSPETAFSNPIDQSKPAIIRQLAAKVVLEMEIKRP